MDHFDDDYEDIDDSVEGEVDVTCPYCGETQSLAIDTGGGNEQEYVQDCEVCCQPWRVHVMLTRGGGARVHLEEDK